MSDTMPDETEPVNPGALTDFDIRTMIRNARIVVEAQQAAGNMDIAADIMALADALEERLPPLGADHAR